MKRDEHVQKNRRAFPTAGMNFVRTTGCGEHTAEILVQEGSQPRYAAGCNEDPGQGLGQGAGQEARRVTSSKRVGHTVTQSGSGRGTAMTQKESAELIKAVRRE